MSRLQQSKMKSYDPGTSYLKRANHCWTCSFCTCHGVLCGFSVIPAKSTPRHTFLPPRQAWILKLSTISFHGSIPSLPVSFWSVLFRRKKKVKRFLMIVSLQTKTRSQLRIPCKSSSSGYTADSSAIRSVPKLSVSCSINLTGLCFGCPVAIWESFYVLLVYFLL